MVELLDLPDEMLCQIVQCCRNRSTYYSEKDWQGALALMTSCKRLQHATRLEPWTGAWLPDSLIFKK